MKTNLKLNTKALRLAVIFAFICSVFWSFADFDASCEDLRHNILRLHIVANSNSPADQNLKLKVRDAILQKSENLFEGEKDLQNAIVKAKKSIPEFQKEAENVIKANGYSYPVKVKIGKAFFETRIYDTFTLPSGEYESLIINIGEGNGKNWWCVVFPAICLPTAQDAKLESVVNRQSAEISQTPQNYEIRFKTVEIYEKIKRWIKSTQ